jgi:hypothetical protein
MFPSALISDWKYSINIKTEEMFESKIKSFFDNYMSQGKSYIKHWEF